MAEDIHDLEVRLREGIAAYIDDQREAVEYWRGTESDAQGISDAIDDAIMALRLPLNPGIAAKLSRFRNLDRELHEPAWEQFTARVFEVLFPNLVRLEERLGDVIRLADAAKPSQRSADALSKLVRCYLFGFDAETVAMCRAVLDASASDALAPQPGDPSKPDSRAKSLKEKIDLLGT